MTRAQPRGGRAGSSGFKAIQTSATFSAVSVNPPEVATVVSQRLLAWLLAACAAIVFLLRGPGRALREGDDLAPAYAASRTWLLGENPYNGAALTTVLFEAGRGEDGRGRRVEGGAIYPPGMFVVLAPLAVFAWPAARVAFLIVALVLFVLHARALLRLASTSLRETDGVWLIGGVLALAPYHTGIALGQVAIPCIALVVMALERSRSPNPWPAGLLLAVATLLKAQIAAPFILYFFLRHRARHALVATVLVAAVTAFGIGWLAIHHIDWLADWRTAVAGAQVGVEHDPSGPFSAQLVDLRPLIAVTLGSAAPGVSAFVIAGLLGLLAYAWGRTLDDSADLLLASLVSVLTTLAVYHRFYDAAILSLPLAWGITQRGERALQGAAWGILGCCAVFFVPGAWMLQRLVNDGSVSQRVAQSPAWNVLLLRHQNWAMLALVGLTLFALYRSWQGERPSDAMNPERAAILP